VNLLLEILCALHCLTFSTAKSARAYRFVGDLPVSEFPKAQADHWHHRWIFGERNSSALLARISRATRETKDGPWSSAERILSTETRCIFEALTQLEVKRITGTSQAHQVQEIKRCTMIFIWFSMIYPAYVCKHNCWPPNTFALANHAFILTLGCRSSEVQSLALENYAKSIQYIIVYGPWFGIQRPINYNSNTQSSKDSRNLLHVIQLQKSNRFREIHDAVQQQQQVSETNLCNLEATCLMFRLDSGNKSINKWSKINRLEDCTSQQRKPAILSLRPLRLWPL
jgi:hypothetical protein